MSLVEGSVLSIQAVSFDQLRTNGWDAEGLITNGR